MALVQLSYFSRPAEGVNLKQDVKSIVNTARRRNRENWVTGFLMFRHDLFTQVLEGQREVVSQLFQRICTDPRHEGVVLVGCETIRKRRFAEWSMGFLSLQEANRELILRYGESPHLDLRQLDHRSLVEFAAEFSAAAVDRALPELLEVR